jgi:hypothetical protein
MIKELGFSLTHREKWLPTVWVPDKLPEKPSLVMLPTRTVVCRPGGVVRPVRWPAHRLGLLPSSPPSLGQTPISPSSQTLVSLSNRE